MRELALVAIAAVAIGCNGLPGHHPVAVQPDAPPDAYVVIECNCNELAQAGCDPGQKCQWLVDSTMPPLGHIECAPQGTVAVGGTCEYGPPVPPGEQQCVSGSYDDCAGGAQCWSGRCEQICDPQGGSPMCPAGYACVTHDGLFEYVGQFAAGVCEPT